MSQPDLWPQLVRLLNEYAIRKYADVPVAISIYLQHQEQPTHEPLPPLQVLERIERQQGGRPEG